MLLNLPAKVQLKEKHMLTMLGHDNNGKPGAHQLELAMTHSFAGEQQQTNTDYLELSTWLCKLVCSLGTLHPLSEVQSSLTFPMLNKPFGLMASKTQQETRMAS